MYKQTTKENEMTTFMEQQITEHREWIAVDTDCGTTYIPMSVVYDEKPDSIDYKDLEMYLEDDIITDAYFFHGYGARLSAFGYMDCTEWTVFEYKIDAENYLTQLTQGD